MKRWLAIAVILIGVGMAAIPLFVENWSQLEPFVILKRKPMEQKPDTGWPYWFAAGCAVFIAGIAVLKSGTAQKRKE